MEWLHQGPSHLRHVACHAKRGWVKGVGLIQGLTRPVGTYISYTRFSSRVVSVTSQAQHCTGKTKTLFDGLLRLGVTCPDSRSLWGESFGLWRFIPID